MIPAAVIEDLKFRNRIEDVIGSYVTLSRSGSNLKGLCPFHSEKSPSFTVFCGDSHFYCFGCGAGGDVVSFIMRAENLDYKSALTFLADRAGVTLPEDDNITPRGVSRQRVLEMNKCAARFFRETLFSAPEGEAGREYLMGKRALSTTIIKRFGLGYAPDSFDSLRKHLQENGFSREEMTEGYLCQKSRKNEDNIYDCFRARVMFPIIDTAGNVIAFGGRVTGDGGPKYLNSADTPAFRKSRNLFALNFAKNYAGDGFILCEGYMDVISLHEAGFQNAVATLGTAITPDQARIMKRYTDKVIISYDSDEAGRKAADKALRLLAEVGVDAKVLKMTGAKDPDEYIKKFGADKFSTLTRESRTRFDYKIDGVKEKYDISVPEEKIKAAAELCREIADVYSRVERDIYVEKTAKELDVDIRSIKFDVEAILKKKSRENKKERKNTLIRETSAIGDRTNPDKAKNPRCGALEEIVLGIMLCRPEYIRDAGEQLNADDFFTPLGKRYFEFMVNAEAAGGFDFGMLPQEFTVDEISRATKLKTERSKLHTNNAAAFSEACAELKKETARQKEKDAGTLDLAELIRRRRDEI